ncbi:MAG: SPOR domain-containing protein [Balneolaceae bacterium]|nr:SPOR domain-containing protein [Balneolaceae bacterium]MBO6546386.1 SPOR domain-containing protein [Balneolaceae bacterium]MBO6648745.1 SPOR domain-containing protein [Balneolaceae bacterium]
MKYVILILFFSGLFLNCSSSKPNIEECCPDQSSTAETSNTQQTENENEKSSSSENIYTRYRSSLSDTYSAKSNEIPLAYQEIKVVDESEDETDMFEGYRVQIYSGQNVAMADTIASIFRAWSDTTIVGYQADTYTFFKSPYYRVHVGDFHERNRAIYFSNILKRRFRDAWVVYDRIDPWKIPADTTDIYTK